MDSGRVSLGGSTLLKRDILLFLLFNIYYFPLLKLKPKLSG